MYTGPSVGEEITALKKSIIMLKTQVKFNLVKN